MNKPDHNYKLVLDNKTYYAKDIPDIMELIGDRTYNKLFCERIKREDKILVKQQKHIKER